ncbi:hypothetical protein NDK50_15120 [Paraburkholderia bryophila]|uniref:hypothetical protein n=1 Tax=Paraburkholderia bryophila TaxID=420952 RepID=UPI002348F59D|nr:hypothetical protein [Paraburkholderia bryophila]WCM18761.1 hypothetical protein NDK50_15120 [Paraburkholderia bryophila]
MIDFFYTSSLLSGAVSGSPTVTFFRYIQWQHQSGHDSNILEVLMNLLSPHEIATLFIIQNASQEVNVLNFDALHLQHVELVTAAPTSGGEIRLTPTSKGRDVLRRLKTELDLLSGVIG